MYEYLGIIATLFILFSFLKDDEKEIRKLNIIGSILFVIYGVCIKSFSTAILNFILIIVNVCKIRGVK